MVQFQVSLPTFKISREEIIDLEYGDLHIPWYIPGETIKEQCLIKKISEQELANKMGVSKQFVQGLINGDIEITQDTAQRLERVLDIPVQFWVRISGIKNENE